MKVILHLTTNCNLRCRYCYAPAKRDVAMPPETAKKAIDLAIQHGNGSACVSYFGGEPLLRFDAIRELTAYATARARERGSQMHFRMSTNGTLFTRDSLAFCRDHNILFAISLDGDREAHDAQRVTAEGTGSWALLDRKLDLILSYNPHTVATSVITPQTVDRLESSIRYIWSRGVRYIVHQLDYSHPDWTPEHFVRLEAAYRALAEFYLEKVRAGEAFHMGLFDDKLKTHAASPIELGVLCDFGAKKVSVAPDGRIFPCVQFVSDRPDAANFCIGHVDRGFTPLRDELIAKNRSGRPDCEGCALLGRCSNYCGCMNWQLTGKVTATPPILCAHERMLVPIADEVGNTLWDERNRRFMRRHYDHFEELFAYGLD
ncbi:MAG: radical SAM protein [Myxococcales bacterium]|nr:MAG: radical SAM protein [Myxococcales bacterium]